MIIFLSTNYRDGYLFEGDAAIDILKAFDKAASVTSNGYGSDRTFTPKDHSETPVEFISKCKLITDEAEAEYVKAARKAKDKADSEAYNARKEATKAKEELAKLKAKMAEAAGLNEEKDGDKEVSE